MTDLALSKDNECDESQSLLSTSEQSSTLSATVINQPRPQPSTSPDLTQTTPNWLINHDIGDLISPEKIAAKISQDLKKLSNSDKYSLLYNHANPPSTLPSTYSHGCNRKFNISWLGKYPWLRYSPRLDGVFCGPCSLLIIDSKRSDKSCLVNRSFSNWVKISDTMSKHSKLSYHQDSVTMADTLKSTVGSPSSRVDVRVVQQQMKDNKDILHQIVKAILFLGKQSLALRGDVEDVTDSMKNLGNFLALLKLFSQNDPLLHSHLYSPRAKNATYLCPSK